MTPTRPNLIAALQDPCDVLILGGGATGLGLAVDAVTRGYKTCLVEAGDYAQATSSRSTKLVHGGVRYLATGQVHLVREALHERAVMRRAAPHLVHSLPTILPATHAWQLPWFGAGLTLYDLLSGSSTMGPTRILGKQATIDRLPGIATGHLSGSILYHDAQFNDARFALALALTALDHGATVLNYTRCIQLCYTGSRISGARVRDLETGTDHNIRAKCVINATGIFSDTLRHLDQPTRPPLLTVSRGTHIVVPARFLGGDHALMVPKTEDGRVIFAIPWQGVVLIGTTDIPDSSSVMEPTSAPDEIDYLLAHIRPYLSRSIARTDILSTFSGLRPLVTGTENKTSKLSREHHIDASTSGLVTVAGGKWTTYRRMAQDTLDFAIRQTLLPPASCRSATLPLHGTARHTTLATHRPTTYPAKSADFRAEYGTDGTLIEAIAAEDPALAFPIHSMLPYTYAMVLFAVRHEQARTLEDVLSRRTRALLLNSIATLEAAPAVAAFMAKELARDEAWVTSQLQTFKTLVHQHYLPTASAAAPSSNLHPAP